MPLSLGDKLGHYEVLSRLGEGGMGQVYKARDTTLKRDVALKVLPATFLRDPERMARFQREAEVLASLDHTNIGPIYGIIDSEDSRGLVLALIEGPTLLDQIGIGPLPLDDALSIAKQIIEALEYAHDRGVVHRDLKPANIKITPDGVVKVLDFGLAKVLEDEPPASSLGNSPTLTLGHTRAGMILGTAAYMSPEQAIGRPVDRRSDIFSFGAVLFEMLTGKRAFAGAATPDVLEAVVKTDPDWPALPAGTPGYVRRLLERCLTKDRKVRLQAIGEARIMLAKPHTDEPTLATGATAPLPSPRGWTAWVVAGLAMVGALGVSFLHFREQPPPAELVRFQIPLPENTALAAWVPLSPNGRMVAFVAQDRDGRRRLWVRPLDVLQARSIAEVNTSTPYPFWSPDSRSLAYFSDGKLKKVDVAGGPPINLCDIKAGFGGGSWSPEGTIVYGTYNTALFRISQAGGVPAALTNLDGAHGESKHAYPFFLPDGRHFLYLRLSGSEDREGIYVGSLDNAPEKQSSQRLLAAKTQAEYAASPSAASGHLLFLHDTTLMAQPFDPAKLALSGDPVPVVDPLNVVGDYAYFSASAGVTRALSYSSGTPATAQLTWLDRGGKILSKPGEPVLSTDVAISPDGSQAAVVRNGDIWVLEFARNSSSRLTSDPAAEVAPVWSPDGKRIVFSSARVGAEGLSLKAANGATPEEQILRSKAPLTPTSWSRDGKYLLYTSVDSKTKADIWVLSAPGSASSGPDAEKPKPFLQTADTEGQARFSPDGKWVVYTSDESGAGEVYVRSFPDAGNKMKVSVGNGVEPHWSADGKEIFYRHGRQVMAVPVTLGATLTAGSPKQLFEATITGAGNADRHPNFVISPDGKQFLALVSGESNSSDPITVLLNWHALLKK